MRFAITSAMINMTANVTKYCPSEIAKLNRGGTKKKSKARTFNSATMSDGRRPSLNPATVTPNRYTITRFESSKRGYIQKATPVHTAVVRYVTPGQPVLVEGNWGWMGVFVDEAAKSPYGVGFTYYRTPRPTHQLALTGPDSGPDPPLTGAE